MKGLNAPLVARPAVPSPHTIRFQFDLAAQSMHEVENLYKAGYWAACVSWAYQAILHASAGLLYAKTLRPLTEKEVRVAFAAAFVAPGSSDPKFDVLFRRIEALRQRGDFDHDHEVTKEEATEARDGARAFWAEAQRLDADVLKDSPSRST